ncbi:hypothetical protein BDZ89DRAFT_1139750 [Hymenopellis radicata]|nr:hypothetical protein BDZ89DRAFT_1139750 [Hymenopellis radicata]
MVSLPIYTSADELASQVESEDDEPKEPQTTEEGSDGENSVVEDEHEQTPIPWKGKGKAHDPVDIVDEFGEQLKMDAEESIQMRLKKDTEAVGYTSIRERRVRKQEALLKATQDEESPLTKGRPHLVSTMAATANIRNKAPPQPEDNPFAANPSPRTPSLPTRRPRTSSESMRPATPSPPLLELHPTRTMPQFSTPRIAMGDPYALVFIALGVKFRTNALGHQIKELRRLLSDFKVEMTNVEIYPFRSSLEQGISYDDDDEVKAIKDEPEDDSDVDMVETDTVVSQSIDWTKVRDDNLPAPGFMVTGLEAADSEFFAEAALLVPRRGLSFGHWTFSDEFTDEEVIEATVTSVQYHPLFMGGNAHYQAEFKALGHIDAPFLNPMLLGLFALIINSLIYKGRNGKGGIGVVGRPLTADAVVPTDHPTGHCPITKLIKELNAKPAMAQGASKRDEAEEPKEEEEPVIADAMDVDPFGALPRVIVTARGRARARGGSVRPPPSTG